MRKSVGEGFKPSWTFAWMCGAKITASTLHPRSNRSLPRNYAGGFETLPYDLASQRRRWDVPAYRDPGLVGTCRSTLAYLRRRISKRAYPSSFPGFSIPLG